MSESWYARYCLTHRFDSQVANAVEREYLAKERPYQFGVLSAALAADPEVGIVRKLVLDQRPKPRAYANVLCPFGRKMANHLSGENQ